MTKRMLAMICLCLMVLTVPAFATEPENTGAQTLPPILVGVQTLQRVPESWNPLAEPDADQKAILALTGEPIYRLSGGSVVPAQAAALPVDVTAEFAGSYGIPADAARGYAFAMELREGAFWDNGKAVTVSDWCYTLEMLLEKDAFPLEIAHYRAWRQGATRPAAQVVSLAQAGYSSVEEAEAAGITDFYIDTTWFWGLDAGWLRATDRTRLHDTAIPSGCGEMYITPAYLYREYLSSTGSQKLFQSEYVGVPVEPGEKLTMEDVGLLVHNDRLVLILQEQSAASQVALSLTGIYPVPQASDPDHYGTADHYRSCGQYRVDTAADGEITLVPNPLWTGEPAEFEWVRCVRSS